MNCASKYSLMEGSGDTDIGVATVLCNGIVIYYGVVL